MNSINNTILNDIVSFEFKANMYHIISNTIEATARFLHEHRDFFDSSINNDLKTRIQTFAIEKQIYDSAFFSNAPYRVSKKKLNGFNKEIPLIQTDEFISTLSRTLKADKLPNKSLYKIELSQGNKEYENQLYFDFEQNNSISSPKTYLIVAYGYQHGEITHMNIILPSPDFKNILESINLLNNVQLLQGHQTEEQKEDNIVKIKNEIKNKFNISK